MDRLHETGLDRGDHRGMRIERPVAADLALQPETRRIGGQQQFDRGGVEADAVVQALHAILGVDALDRHHRHQHLYLGDLRRVAGEQRLDEMRARAGDHEVHPVAGNIHARHLVHQLVDLRDHDAVLERGGLDDRGRVLGVRAGVQIALRIGGLRGHQRDMRRQVDEIAAEQFEISVDRADAYLLLAHHARQSRAPAGRRTRSRLAPRCRARTDRDARAAPAPIAACAVY